MCVMIDHVNDLIRIMSWSWSLSWSVSLVKALDVAVSASLASIGVSPDDQSCLEWKSGNVMKLN